MADGNWSEMMLEVYIYDYLMKKNLQKTARSLLAEGMVTNPVAIDAPRGLLFDCWSVFWNSYSGRTSHTHFDCVAAYMQAQEDEMKMQQQRLIRQAQMQPYLGGPVDAYAKLGKSNARDLGVKMDTNPLNSQIQTRAQQNTEIKREVNLGTSPRKLPVDPSTVYGQGTLQSNPGNGCAGFNNGVSILPLKPWPSTGMAQTRPGLGPQAQESFQQNQRQSQLSLQQQQQLQQGILAQVQEVGNVANNPVDGDKNPQRFTGLPRGNMKPKDSKRNSDDESVGSSIPNYTPFDGNMPKVPMMYGSDATSGIASSRSQLDKIGHVKMEAMDKGSFVSTQHRDFCEHAKNSKGFSFSEVGSIRSESEVICCNFSSDGKLLASAGYDKKVVVWNMETLQTESIKEEHGHIITDVRFRHNSTQLATSSFDKTIKIWDASKPGSALRTLARHNATVMSIDFHPKRTNLLCSCDRNSDIRFWDINNYTSPCVRALKGASTQVRFQPRTGQLLAAASENAVSIVDLETSSQVHILQGHLSNIRTVCWNTSGELIASISEDIVKIWSLNSPNCIHEYISSGENFQSCVFHPTYPNILVIGCYQSLVLWNTINNTFMNILAHECVIPALDQSPCTGMIASASHDKSVKIWK